MYDLSGIRCANKAFQLVMFFVLGSFMSKKFSLLFAFDKPILLLTFLSIKEKWNENENLNLTTAISNIFC